MEKDMFFIRKSSRDAKSPYEGPSLERAGIESRWYLSREEAQRDADRLSEVNPVGFVVDELVERVAAEAEAIIQQREFVEKADPRRYLGSGAARRVEYDV